MTNNIFLVASASTITTVMILLLDVLYVQPDYNTHVAPLSGFKGIWPVLFGRLFLV